jgi:hypothetical protein
MVILEDAKKASRLSEIKYLNDFNSIYDIMLRDSDFDVDRELVHSIDSIINYLSLFFTLSNYVYQIGEIKLSDFNDAKKKQYRSVDELLMGEYGMPSVMQIDRMLHSNKRKAAIEWIERSRGILIEIIKNVRGLHGERLTVRVINGSQDSIAMDAENTKSTTMDGERDWNFNELVEKINSIRESYDLAMR